MANPTVRLAAFSFPILFTVTVDAQGSYTAGTIYSSAAQNSNDCPNGSTEPSSSDCDIMASVIQSANSGYTGYQELLAILRAAIGAGSTADFALSAQYQVSAIVEVGSQYPMICSM